MKELDLIVSQEKLEQNRKNALLKEASKYYKNKQNELRAVCTYSILALTLILAMAWVLNIGMNLKKTGYHNCMETMNDQAYCLKNS